MLVCVCLCTYIYIMYICISILSIYLSIYLCVSVLDKALCVLLHADNLVNNNNNNSTIAKGLLKGLEDLEVGGRVRDYPNDSIAENGRNPETSPGDSRRHTVISNYSEKLSAKTDEKKPKRSK